MLKDRLLELIGYKKPITTQEMEEAELKSRQLTVDYMGGRIPLNIYREELDKLPKLDLRKLAQGLGY